MGRRGSWLRSNLDWWARRGLEKHAEGGLFFEEDFVGALREKLGEGRETFVDEDDLTLVLIQDSGARHQS
jgi:hypothetical protein